MALSYSEAKQVPIQDYLSRLGFEPDKIRGNNYWYRSPFRNEAQASFKMDIKRNVWYDHGSGEGGNLLDLGAKLEQCTIRESSKDFQMEIYRFSNFRFISNRRNQKTGC